MQGPDPAGAPPAPSMKRTLARNTSANAIAQAVQAVSAIVFMPLLIKTFGVATYGAYLFSASLGGYMIFLDFGVGVSLTKLLAEYRAKGNDDYSSRLVSSALAFYGAVGILGTAVLLAVARWVVPLFHFSPAEVTVVRQMLTVSAILSPVTWPVVSVTAIQAGLNRYDSNAVATLITTLLNAAIMVAVVVGHLSPVLLWIGVSTSTLVGATWNWRRALSEMHGSVHIRAGNVHPSALKPLIKMSVYVFIIQVSGVVAYQQTDRLIVGYFVGAAAVTLYEAAAKMEMLVRQLSGVVSSALVPATSHLDAQEDRDALRSLLLRGTRYASFLVLPVVVGLTILARPLLVTWLGPKLAASTLPAQLFLSYWLLSVNISVVGPMIVGIGRLDRVIWWQNLGTTLNITLGIVLTWKFGLIGVILGTVVSHVIVLPPYLRIGYRLLGASFGEWVRHVFVPAYPPLVLTAAIAVLGYALHLTSTLAGVAVVGLASVGVYWLAVYTFIFTPDERGDVAALRTAVIGRLRRAR